MTRIIRGIIESYDESTHQADVRPAGHPSALLADIPVIETCPGELIPADQAVSVLVWPDLSGLVLGPYGDTFKYPVQGRAYSSTTYTFTSSSSPESWVLTAPQLTLTIAAKSYFWIYATMTTWSNGSGAKSIAVRLQLRVDSTNQTIYQQVCSPASSYYMPLTLAGRTANSFAAGTYVLKLIATTYQSGWSQRFRFGTLCAWAQSIP